MVALDGEEEPYFKMSGNGFGLTSVDDSLTELKNPTLFRSLILEEIHTLSPYNTWRRRLQMQFRSETLYHLLNQLPEEGGSVDWLRGQGVIGHYDGCKITERKPFREITYEMPPFVVPTIRAVIPTSDKVLLLKSPYNAFRRGVIEAAFPRVEITYVLLTRNPGATVNGLIDGWRANYGFHKHLTNHGWWKFEAPPGWKEYLSLAVPERAAFQWASSYEAILSNYLFSCTVKFEDILESPEETLLRLCKVLDIIPPSIGPELPNVMTTESPTRGRWRNRETTILPLLTKHKALFTPLGYPDPCLWY